MGKVHNGSGFYDPGVGFPNRLQLSISGGVIVKSINYINPTTITALIDTTNATSGIHSITVTNPDGQQTSASALSVQAVNPIVTGPTGATGNTGLSGSSGTSSQTGNTAATGVTGPSSGVYMTGIFGASVGSNPAPVLVDASGRLGTVANRSMENNSMIFALQTEIASLKEQAQHHADKIDELYRIVQAMNIAGA